MGADIHMVIEKKIKIAEHPTWVGLHHFPYIQGLGADKGYHSWAVRSRNYRLFARLAGVRGEGPEARGLPEDISLLALHKVAEDAGDGHSHTFYGLGDFLLVYKEIHDLRDEEHRWEENVWRWPDDSLFDVNVSYSVDAEGPVLASPAWIEAANNEYRLIIWFDN